MEGRPESDSVWRLELGRLLALLGVSALAVAQPVLDAFGRSPETFVFRDAEGFDLVLFALVVALGPALVVWALGLLVGAVAPRWRTFAHGLSVALFVALAIVPALHRLGAPLTVTASIAAGMVAWVLTVRSSEFRLWGQLLAALTAFAMIAFLVASPSSKLVTSASFAAASVGGGAVPVVLIVLDELPTASLLDGDGHIDPVRFPNLARLAAESTWYRNNTTQAGFTKAAVPAILTGQEPTAVASVFVEHPDNLFRLLAGSHDLVVSEALTRLCPTSVCGDHPTAPATAAVDGVAPEASSGADMAGLLGDAVSLWADRVTGADGPNLGGFEEWVESASGPDSADDAAQGPTWEQAVATQPGRLTEFLDALQPGDRPLAAVLHLVAPHAPWRYLPDGRRYADPAEAADLPINGDGDPWVAQLERQRHLLQASYVDRLVGQILDRVEEAGIYDDAAIVVTADHGVAFHGKPNRRATSLDALPEIMWTPLIVKAPGQTDARVDDTNTQSVDVVPTIADLIGVEIPWSVDGFAAGSQAQLDRGPEKPFHRFAGLADPLPAGRIEVDGSAGFATMLDLAFPPVVAGADPVSALAESSGRGDLVGTGFAPVAQLPRDTFAIDDRDRLLQSADPVLVVSGTVDDGDRGADHVVAAYDGRIVAVSPVVERNRGGRAFVLLLPADEAVDLARVRLGLVVGDTVLDTGSIG